MACALQRPARSPTRCAPAWTAWPQAVAAVLVVAAVVMAAAETAPVVDTVAVAVAAALAAVVVAVTVAKPLPATKKRFGAFFNEIVLYSPPNMR